MAEVVFGASLGGFFTVLIEKLASGSSQYLRDFIRSLGIDEDEWNAALQRIRDVLEDAEEKQLTNRQVRRWLDNLHDLAYDIEDIIDELAIEAQARASGNKFVAEVMTSAASQFNRMLKPDDEMKTKIEDISRRLEGISKGIMKLGLNSNVVGERMVLSSRQTTSLPPTRVFGREKEKKEIVEMLMKPKADSTEIPVITIIGMGGMGKTTLAQDVYNDKEVKGCFDLRAWVCVSDVFDVSGITRAILKDIPGADNTEKLELNQLQVKLMEMLSGKKFLLVLDDIWNEDYENWEHLLRPFPSGEAAAGSRILATTRNESVASIMSLTRSWYHITKLEDDDCLSLLASHALGRDDFDLHLHLKESGEKIVKKCGHLPLAIKMVAGLLRNKLQRQCWEDVINSNKWAKISDRILLALGVSYYHLPSHLKRCFAYCSIIPKNYIFDKNDLVLLWMAEGLLEQPAGGMEDFGHDCFQELLSRSFFQLISGNESEFIMHDLINDLAVHVAGERCFRMDDAWDENRKYVISERTRHLSFISQNYEVSKKFDIFNPANRTRTFLALPPDSFSSDGYIGIFVISETILPLMLSRLRYLRVLNLRGYCIDELPNAIGALKHLRYLNLTGTYIEQLPQVVCSLYNLQTLSLNSCPLLRKLPSSIGCLTNLRHLGLEGTPKLKKMPSGIGKLTSLQTLSKIIAGRDTRTSNLKDLKGLIHLHGTLSIEELQNVTDIEDVVAADLRYRDQLENVKLQWQYFRGSVNSSRDRPLENRVLEKLQPHCNLKVLDIEGYGGIEFPSWVGGQSMSNVVKILLHECSEITHLPPLGELPFLKDLVIEGLGSITSVGAEFYGGCVEEIVFPSLETLSFCRMTKWKEWSPPIAGKGLFPHLRDLKIFNCGELEKLPKGLPRNLKILQLVMCAKLEKLPKGLPRNLKDLKLEKCAKLEKLPKGLHGLASLEEMKIIFCQSLVWDATDRLPKSLIKLELKNCPKSVLSNWGFHRLTSLRSLSIRGYEDVVSFEQVIGDSTGGGVPTSTSTSTSYLFPPSLTELTISLFPNLESLSNSLQNLTSLRELSIFNCPKLESLAGANDDAASLQIISSLHKLAITGRSSEVLREQCKEENGKYWSTIQHIPLLDIRYY